MKSARIKPVYVLIRGRLIRRKVLNSDMAKWVLSTPPPFTGTKYGVTVYQLPDEKWYVRMKSSITGERIKKDPVFKAFRKSSGRMKEASPIASFVYKQLRIKHYPLYREMTGKAMLWLKEDIFAAVIQDRLVREYLQPYTSIKKLPSRPTPKRILKNRVFISNPFFKNTISCKSHTRTKTNTRQHITGIIYSKVYAGVGD